MESPYSGHQIQHNHPKAEVNQEIDHGFQDKILSGERSVKTPTFIDEWKPV